MRAFILAISLALVVTGCKKPDFRYDIVYVNSYHQGYPPSDAVMQAKLRDLPADTFKITSFFMDTKRKSDSASIELVVTEILNSVREIDPDLIVVSDDAAVKYLISQNLAQLDMPIVYCGVNWSTTSYSLDKANVTGMIEVLPLKEMLSFLQDQPTAHRTLAILSENSVSEKQNSLLLDTLYRTMGFTPEYFLVDNFQSWKEKFSELNQKFDVIYLPTNGAISGWKDDEARKWVGQHIRVPVFTCDDFMMPYAAVGFTKIPEEHGEYVSRTARRILTNKTSIRELTQEKNKLFKVYINIPLSERINLAIPDSLMLNATQIQ